MSAPLTIKDHIDALMREDTEGSCFFVVFHDPHYGYARVASFGEEESARDYYAEKKREGRKPRFLMRDIRISTYEE